MWNGLAAIALIIGVAQASAAAGREYRLDDMTIRDAWARATPGTAATGAVYLTIFNHGQVADRLVAAATPVADRAELHVHRMKDGVMKMRAVDAIDVAPGRSATLAPGGLHIMLFRLKQPQKEGDRFPITLRFESAGPVTIEVRVLALGAAGPTPVEGHEDMTHEPHR